MDHDKTLELLAKALEIAPGDWETRSHMASLCIELGRLEQAAELLTEAPELPADGPGKLAAAELLALADAGSPALQVIDTLLAENKANAKAHLLKAKIYRGRGMQPEARKHYNVAAVIDESLEDPEFEAWLEGRPMPAPTLKEPPAGLDSIYSERPAIDISLPSPFDDLDIGCEKTHFQPPRENVQDDEPPPEVYDPFDELEDDPFDDDYPQDPFHGRPMSTGKELPRISFSDVGGMEVLKQKVRMKIIYPFKNRSVFEKFKKSAGGGLLLYGPPGCGKTLIARATAGECGAYFQPLSIPDILSKWFGESEARLHELFESVRQRAPSILFIDELDALGVKRSDAVGAMGSLVNVLLTEIDGAACNNEDVLVLGATNSPWRIDPAFRRPGRFDQTVFVPPPDDVARTSIFEILLKELPCEKVNIPKLVSATDSFSGADIRAAVDAALDLAIAEEMRSGADTKLTGHMLQSAIKLTRPTTLEWFEQAANYASYANTSGVYDELAEYLRNR